MRKNIVIRISEEIETRISKNSSFPPFHPKSFENVVSQSVSSTNFQQTYPLSLSLFHSFFCPSLLVPSSSGHPEGSKSPGNTNSRVPSNTINLSSGGGGTSSFDSRCFVGVERGGIRNLGSSPVRACKNQSNRGDLRGGATVQPARKR